MRRDDPPMLQHRGCRRGDQRGKADNALMLEDWLQQTSLATPESSLACRQTFAEEGFKPLHPRDALAVAVGLILQHTFDVIWVIEQVYPSQPQR